jgi:hypothetical protein
MVEKLRKPYSKPQLMSLGDLRTLTLGGSPGYGDTGGSSMCEKRGTKGLKFCPIIPNSLFSPNKSSILGSIFPSDQTPTP